MDAERFLVGLVFFFVAAACLVSYFRQGKLLKKMKSDLGEMGKELEETKPPSPTS